MPPAPTTTKTLTSSASDEALVSPEHSAALPRKSMTTNGHVIGNGISHRKTPSLSYQNGSTVHENHSPVANGKPPVAEDVNDEVDMYGPTKADIVWKNVIVFAYLHMAALYGAYLWVSGQVMWQTFLWGFKYYCMSGFGITAGTHRYWAHKSYKAKAPLRLFLAYMQTISCQNSIHEWCRDHRLHHKYTETNADPHNVKRGFFFAHMGWLLCKKHPAVKVVGKRISMADLEADPIVMFQKKYYKPLVLFGCFVIPTLVPYFVWGESLIVSFFFAAIFRYVATLHCTWLINSAAHVWGPKPYDKRIHAAENKMAAWWAFGEGWHNYHHVFPWDYKTAELGIYRYNFSAAFIDFMARIGQAYDLKTVPSEIVQQRVARTGDGTHAHFEPGPWGWDDQDIPVETKEVTETLFPVSEKSQ